MNLGMYSQLTKIEDNHWWFISRRKLIENLLPPYLRFKNGRALDIGCGTGGNLKLLRKYCPRVVGIDISKFAIKLAKKKFPKYHFKLGDANKLTKIFSKKSFDLITIFNVLYHRWIINEQNILEQINTLLKPGGYLVITEPAFDFLKREHDIIGMGKCRYNLPYFEKKLRKIGFKIITSTYFNSISFLPAFIIAFYDRFSINKTIVLKNEEPAELQIPPILLNKFLLKLMNIETKIIKLVGKMPFGVSLLIIAQKPRGKKII